MATDLDGALGASAADDVVAAHDDAASDEDDGVDEVADVVQELSVDGGMTTTAAATAKKRKKKKSKSKAKATAAAAVSKAVAADAGRIKISRNKHTKFISSYHVGALQALIHANIILMLLFVPPYC